MKIVDIYFFIKGYLQAKIGVRFSRSSIHNFQKKRFKQFSYKTLSASRYYSQYVGKDIEHFPIMNKKIHMENFDQINTQNLSRDKALKIAIDSEKSRDFEPEYEGFSVGLSSGTSGNRGLFILSSKERALWAGYIIGKMLPLTMKKQKVAFFLRANNHLYETSNGLFLTFKFYDLLQGIEKNIQSLNTFSPSILIAPASVLKKIAESKAKIYPKRIISVAEVLEVADKEVIENIFHVKVEQIYQCTEGFLAASCKQGGIHLNEDAYIIEKQWIDKSTGRFSPIITDLNRVTQPIVRYLLDDVLIVKNEPCACGSSMQRIEKIEGRCDDILLLKNIDNKKVDVFPDLIRNTIISSCGSIEEYRLIQIEENTLQIQVSPYTGEIIQSLDDSLNRLWHRLSLVVPQCEYIEYQATKIVQKQRRIVRKYHG
ncbi:MAG: F390 synthetase-related protein [Pseudomonadota bacterium]